MTHEAIDEAAAIGVDDPEWGKRLRAFVALREDGALSEDDVKNFVKENLARYKVPREVVFVDALPRNPSGQDPQAPACRDGGDKWLTRAVRSPTRARRSRGS